MSQVHFDIRTTLYPLEAVYSACYAFIDRCYIRLDETARQGIRVYLDPKEPADKAALRRLEGEFRNELLHQSLRLKVSVANQKIREYIVTRALLSAQAPQQAEAQTVPAPKPDGKGRKGKAPQPQAPQQQAPQPSESAPADDALTREIQKLLAEIDKGGDQEDPLGIVAPWEESQGKKAAGDRPEDDMNPSKMKKKPPKKAASAKKGGGK